MEEKKKIEMLVLDCIRRGKEPRRELVWLEEKYQRFAVENRLAGRAQTDAFIYKKNVRNKAGKRIACPENPILAYRQTPACKPGAMHKFWTGNGSFGE